MALLISASTQNKPWLLKDYLLDDLGSCSSSGFRSFPRQKCCVAVRCRSSGSRRPLLLNNSTSCAPSKISCAIRKASMAIISAVKLLPFKSSEQTKQKSSGKKKKKALLPRSLSRGLAEKGVSKKSLLEDHERSRDYEIERWISSGIEKCQPLDLSTSTSSTNGDSWSESDSEFTVTCSSFDENGVVLKKETKRSGESATRGDQSTQAPTTKDNWSDEEEKEQLSPVSVLNFQDDDDEEAGSSSPFTLRLKNLEGTKSRLMQKLRRFECLSRIDPTNLESQLSLSEYSDEELSSSPSPLHDSFFEEETKEMTAERLLKLIKAKKINAYNLNTESLLRGFFLDGLDYGSEKNREVVEETLLKEGEDWLIGRGDEEVSVSVGWKKKEKRKVYAKDMEGLVWRSDVEKDDVVVQVEAQILDGLVDELSLEMNLLLSD